MHSYVIPPLLRGLSALSGLLTKAEAHCAEHSIKPEAILDFRLYPDMLTFTRQVQLTCDFAARLPARLCVDEMPSFPDTEASFAELQARIGKVKAYVEGYTPERLVGAETRSLILKQRAGEMTLTGLDMATLYSMPQFYFHLTTAYDILRHNGVLIGKKDFIGSV